MSRYSRAPVGHTCPDIDSAINLLNDVVDRLEDLRNDNSKLRDWGIEDFLSELRKTKEGK
ncbi:MAG: hypothetical protein WC549_02015 [Actinomycetota bacterium]